MAASRAEKQAQIEALQAELAAEADDVELWVEHEGKKTQLKGAHARRWLKQLGLADEEPAAEGEPADEDPTPPKTKLSERFFESKGK